MQPNSDHCENNVIYCQNLPVEAVETLLASPHFRWKRAKKSVKFICLLATRENCRSTRSGGGLPRKASGTLANRPAQTEQSVGHEPWRQGKCGVREDTRFSEIVSSPAHRMTPSFGKESTTQPSGSVVQGGLQPSCRSTNNCASPVGVAVTVLRDNLCHK